MEYARRSGILLHPTSLPESPGIGTLGKQAYAFADWLESAGQTLWQILPLGPTGYGDSPYASFSTFAGNPLLIDLEELVSGGFLSPDQALPPDYIHTNGNVDFGAVVYWKLPLLKRAALQFLKNADTAQKKKYAAFKKKHALWLENYSVFMSIKEFYDEKARKENRNGAMWSNYWPRELAVCDETAVRDWKNAHAEEAEIHSVIQWFFMSQWIDLKTYVNSLGISIIGDIPIFVAADSADVWSNQMLFQVDKSGKARAVAGVPPDYFSETGQLWGNPLYDWKKMKQDSYAWWIERIRASLALADIVRVDHFRGFEAYWSVPVGEQTAVNGKWVRGPGQDFFNNVKEILGAHVPLIAEDLGVITEKVRTLRDENGFPGMKVLQFAFDLQESKNNMLTNPFLPHMYTQNCVAYTGTHDNDTLRGWLDSADTQTLDLICEYMGCPQESDLCATLVRLALSSAARFAIIPLQDIYGIGNEGRMNFPSKTGGTNWQWRMSATCMDGKKAKELKRLCGLYGRNKKN